MSTLASTSLACRQKALVAALTGDAAAPPGFDADRIRAAALSLARKRAAAVARAWPGLTDALGNGFRGLFADYSTVTPLPNQGGPLADGRTFARWLANRGELPDAGKMQALSVDLHFVATTDGLRPRRGPALKLAWLHKRRRLVIGVRLPWIGVHWF